LNSRKYIDSFAFISFVTIFISFVLHIQGNVTKHLSKKGKKRSP